jgi:hypothetical protein
MKWLHNDITARPTAAWVAAGSGGSARAAQKQVLIGSTPTHRFRKRFQSA